MGDQDKPAVELRLIQDRRSLGQDVLSEIRGRIAGEPPNVAEKDSQWWFMLGWVMRGCSVGATDAAAVVRAFELLTLETGESKRPD